MNKNVQNVAIVEKKMVDGMDDRVIGVKDVVMSSKTGVENGREMSFGMNIVTNGIRIVH